MDLLHPCRYRAGLKSAKPSRFEIGETERLEIDETEQV